MECSLFKNCIWTSDCDGWRLVALEIINFVMCFTSLFSQLLGCSVLWHLLYQYMDFQLCFQYYFYNPASVMIRSGPFLCSHPRIHLLLFAFDECIGNIWLRVFFFLSFILPSAFILFLYDEQIIQHRKNLKYSDK